MSDLEKLFKDGLDDFEEIAPSKSLWWRITGTLFMAKFSAKYIIFIAVAIMFSLFTVSNIYFSDKENQAGNSEFLSNSNIKTEDQQTLSSTTTSNTTEQNTITDEQPNTVLTKEDQSKSNNAPSVSNGKTEKNGKQNFVVNKSNEKQISKTENSSQENNSTSNALVIDYQSESNLELEAESNKEIFIQDGNNNQDFDLSNESGQESEIIIDNQIRVFKSRYYQLPELPFVFNLEKYPNYQFNKSCPKPISKSLEVYAGFMLNDYTLTTLNPVYNDYIDYRQNSESQLITPNIGLNYRFNFNKWFVMIGGTYHQISTKADYKLPVMVIDSMRNYYSVVRMNNEYVVIGTIPNPNDPSLTIPIYGYVSNPDTTVYSDLVVDTNTILKSFTTKQKFTYLEIPLIFGREFHYKKFIFEPSMGVSYGRLMKYETQIPTLNMQNLMTEDEISNLLTYNMFNGIIGLGLSYGFNGNRALFIRPEYKYNFNNMFNNSFPIGQKNGQFRFIIGMRYGI